MNIATADNLLKAVLDTNILVSAIIFGGHPRHILQKVIEGEVVAVTSKFLIAELSDVLVKKFDFFKEQTDATLSLLLKHFLIVAPTKPINILDDKADNRVLEAALEAKVKFIITGDKGLLKLKEFKGVRIVSPTNFLKVDY
jgi:putative PIN family toxin of toxin-antitoxin system